MGKILRAYVINACGVCVEARFKYVAIKFVAASGIYFLFNAISRNKISIAYLSD